MSGFINGDEYDIEMESLMYNYHKNKDIGMWDMVKTLCSESYSQSYRCNLDIFLETEIFNTEVPLESMYDRYDAVTYSCGEFEYVITGDEMVHFIENYYIATSPESTNVNVNLLIYTNKYIIGIGPNYGGVNNYVVIPRHPEVI